MVLMCVGVCSCSVAGGKGATPEPNGPFHLTSRRAPNLPPLRLYSPGTRPPLLRLDSVVTLSFQSPPFRPSPSVPSFFSPFTSGNYRCESETFGGAESVLLLQLLLKVATMKAYGTIDNLGSGISKGSVPSFSSKSIFGIPKKKLAIGVMIVVAFITHKPTTTKNL